MPHATPAGSGLHRRFSIAAMAAADRPDRVIGWHWASLDETAAISSAAPTWTRAVRRPTFRR